MTTKKPKILAFGEIMLRLSPANNGAIVDCNSFDACYGGTEANVLACMSNFGCATQYLTALPDNQLGEAVLNHLHSFHIGTDYVKLGGEVLGSYFVQSGNGSRGASVIYNRSNAEITRIAESDINYDEVFDGVDLFHISGISFALSPSCTATAFRLLAEAKKRNVVVSFDFNYRAKLWTTAQAKKVFAQIIPYADIVLASSLDLSTFLDTDEQSYFAKYQSKYLAIRNRTPLNANKHKVSLTLYKNTDGERTKCVIAETPFDVKEKIGGGDAFDGALLYKLITNASAQQATTFAVKAFICKHQVAGDTFTLSENEVEAANININCEVQIETL